MPTRVLTNQSYKFGAIEETKYPSHTIDRKAHVRLVRRHVSRRKLAQYNALIRNLKVSLSAHVGTHYIHACLYFEKKLLRKCVL